MKSGDEEVGDAVEGVGDGRGKTVLEVGAEIGCEGVLVDVAGVVVDLPYAVGGGIEEVSPDVVEEVDGVGAEAAFGAGGVDKAVVAFAGGEVAFELLSVLSTAEKTSKVVLSPVAVSRGNMLKGGDLSSKTMVLL